MESSRAPDHSVVGLHARIDQLSAQVEYLVARQRKTEEFFEEMTPILKLAMGSATERLEGFERKGYFELGRELVGVGEKIAEGFSPEDVRRLGGAAVGILETVRAMTQPEVLRVASEAASVLEHADTAEPIGILGMVRATSDHDVQKGMSVLMDLMRHVGRAAATVSAQRKAAPGASKKSRLDAVTGAKRQRSLGVERKAPPEVIYALEQKKHRPASQRATGPGCAVPSAGPSEVAAVIDGVGFGADGHLADASTWTRALGERLAELAGVPLTDAHWRLVDAARAEFEKTQISPNIRRLTQLAEVSTREVYALFPKAPARTLAKIAGLPKPAGCL